MLQPSYSLLFTVLPLCHLHAWLSRPAPRPFPRWSAAWALGAGHSWRSTRRAARKSSGRCNWAMSDDDGISMRLDLKMKDNNKYWQINIHITYNYKRWMDLTKHDTQCSGIKYSKHAADEREKGAPGHRNPIPYRLPSSFVFFGTWRDLDTRCINMNKTFSPIQKTRGKKFESSAQKTNWKVFEAKEQALEKAAQNPKNACWKLCQLRFFISKRCLWGCKRWGAGVALSWRCALLGFLVLGTLLWRCLAVEDVILRGLLRGLCWGLCRHLWLISLILLLVRELIGLQWNIHLVFLYEGLGTFLDFIWVRAGQKC